MIKQSQISDFGTAASLDVGTGANNILQLDGSGKLPAVDGSNITNVTGSGGSGGTGGTKVINIEDQVLSGAFQIPNTFPCGTLLRVVNNTGTNALSVTLPSASDFDSGYYLTVSIYKRESANYDSLNTVTLFPKSGDTIFDGGVTSALMSTQRAYTCVSDGSSNWIFVHKGRS